MIYRPSMFLFVLLFGSLGLWRSACAPAQVAVRQSNLLAVRIEAEDRAVFNGVLRVGDLAAVEAENNFLAQRVKALDLEVLTMESPRATITREQIEYRLLLAGIKREQIALTGFERVTVELQDIQQIMQLLAETIGQQCSRKYGTPEGFCQVSLQAEARSLLERSQLNWRTLSLVARLPAELQAGEQLLPVEFYSGSVVTTLQLPVHFRFHRPAAALSLAAPQPQPSEQLPPAGERPANLIPPNSVFAQTPPGSAAAVPMVRLVAPAADSLPRAPQEGRSPVQPVSYEVAESAGTEVLRIAEPEAAPPVAKPAVLVARGATVRLTQKIGNVSIGLKTAKAAGEGRLGEVIEAIAPYKGRDGREIRLLGRVVGENQLELVR